MAQRIQRKRSKGWRMPENAVYVGRPTKWGNPYRAEECVGGAKDAVTCFRILIESEPENIAMVRRELRGKDLACWCSLDEPCHADVLLEIANTFQPDPPAWLEMGGGSLRFHAWRFGAWLYPKPDGACEWDDHRSDGTNPHKAESVRAAKAAILAAYRENEARELAAIEGPTKRAAIPCLIDRD